MARGRMLNKKISQDEKVAKLSLKAALLYTWLIPHADVKGRLYANDIFIKGNIVPHIDEIKLYEINKLLMEISRLGLVLYYGDKVKYVELCGWDSNQNVHEDREAESEIPDPTPELMRNSCVNPAKVKLSLSKDKLNKDIYLNHVYLSKEEYEKLTLFYGKEETEKKIDSLNNYALKIGEAKFKARYKSHYAVILEWDDMDRKKRGEPCLDRPGMLKRLASNKKWLAEIEAEKVKAGKA